MTTSNARYPLDQLMLMLSALLVALPFGQIYQLTLGPARLNAFELLYICLIGVAVALVITRGADRHNGLYFIAWCGLTLAYAVASAAFSEVALGDAFRQLRPFLPFYLATLILSTRLHGSLRSYSAWLTVAAGISAFVALLFHHLFPQVIESAFASSDDVLYSVLDVGRLYWANSLITLLVVARLLVYGRLSSYAWFALILTLIALVNTLSRTAILATALFWVSALILTSANRKRALLQLTGALVVCAALVLVLLSFDTTLLTGIERRFFDQGDIASIYEHAVLISRVVMYEQYLDIISNHVLLGQGLGKPFGVTVVGDALTTDISILTFLLAFGVVGALMFLIFLSLLWHTISVGGASSASAHKWAMSLRVLLALFVLMSLNLDVFTRNNAIIWFAIAAKLVGESYRPRINHS